MASAFYYGIAAQKFTGEGGTEKGNFRGGGEGVWSVSFNLTNTLGFAKQYIYLILNNSTERDLIKQKLKLIQTDYQLSLTTLVASCLRLALRVIVHVSRFTRQQHCTFLPRTDRQQSLQFLNLEAVHFCCPYL